MREIHEPNQQQYKLSKNKKKRQNNGMTNTHSRSEK